MALSTPTLLLLLLEPAKVEKKTTTSPGNRLNNGAELDGSDGFASLLRCSTKKYS
ncbi:hypothetical protein KP509_10G055700 [Ceratopteris richardii]|uniref:Uncharacterized protein n=1 Tax=Ceratopteris richardii TaxID=49495 RepID=A0A8T2U281_CERRI|nr:hypothetical protein KP509_10G055700 [Ceratopteris richardii]